MKNILEILAGPASFAFTAFALTGTFTPAQAFAIGTAVWMALWWILRPVSIYVTAFIPILVDSFFDLIPEGHVLSQYFSEIAVLLLGSDLICLTWTKKGLDRRISVKTLCCICNQSAHENQHKASKLRHQQNQKLHPLPAVQRIKTAAEDIQHGQSQHKRRQVQRPFQHQRKESRKQPKRENDHLKNKPHIQHLPFFRPYYKGSNH